MKILFVAVFTERSTNVWQAKAFEKLGHEVIRFDYRHEPIDTLKWIKNNMNLDAVIFAKCNNWDIKYVNMFSCTKVYWYPDPLVSYTKEIQEKAKACDIVFTSTTGMVNEIKKINKNVFKNYGGYDPDIHKPINIKQDIDVSFIGTTVFGDRQEYINKCNITHLNGVFGLGHSKAVSRSRININLSHSVGASNRLYKIMAAGGFVLTQKYPGLEEDFRVGIELDVFDSPNVLKRKIDYYLDNKNIRENMAMCGMSAVMKYDHIHFAKRIIKKL